jgi:hypothetical protein
MAGEFSGTLQQFWGQTETTFNTHEAFAATDAVNIVSLDIQPEKSYEEIISHAGSGTYEGEVDGATGGKWTATAHMMPAAAGTAPDIGFALGSVLTETVSGGTSVTYAPNDSAPTSLAWQKYSGSTFCEWIRGCSLEQIVLDSGAKGSIPTVTLSGSFASLGFVYGAATVDGAHTAPDSTIAIDSPLGFCIGVGAIVKFGSEDNSGAGYRVTAVTATQLTITPDLAGNISDGVVVAPLTYSQTLGGTRIGGVSHGLTVDAVAVNPITMKYTIDTGVRLMDRESSSPGPTGIVKAAARSCVLEIDAYFKTATMPYFGAAHATTQQLRDFAARYGADTAAARVKVNTDKVLVRVQPVPVQDGEITAVKFTGRARKNAAANDEFSIVWD